MLLIRSTATLFVICLCVAPAFTQQDDCRQRVIPASIGATDGAPVPVLDSSNFEGTFRKKPIRVLSAAMNHEPPRVVLLLDISGSMFSRASDFSINFSIGLAEDLASTMPPDAEIGLAFFNSVLVPVLAPTKDRQGLKYELEGLRAHSNSFKGNTALWDAVLGSAKMFDHPRVGDTIYVITDGGENASTAKKNRVAQTLAEAGVRLFSFIVANEGETAEDAMRNWGVSQSLVNKTGGTSAHQWGIFPIKFPEDYHAALFDRSGKPTVLGSSLATQFHQIFSFYRVTIEFPEPVNKPQDWNLELAGFSKSQRNKLVLTYPKMLVPCH